MITDQTRYRPTPGVEISDRLEFFIIENGAKALLPIFSQRAEISLVTKTPQQGATVPSQFIMVT